MVEEGTLGARLRELRIRQGLTQQQLAHPRFSKTYVSAIEAGRRTPSRKAILHFASVLGVDVEALETDRPAGLETQLEMAAVEARRAISAGAFDRGEEIIAGLEQRAAKFSVDRFLSKAEELRGLSLERRGDLRAAVEKYEAAMELVADRPPYLQAAALAGKSRCVHSLGDSQHSIYLLESLIERIEREGPPEPTALMRLHASLVVPYLSVGDRARAAKAAEEARRLGPETDDPNTLATMHVQVGIVQAELGHYAEADESLRAAQALLRQADHRGEVGMTHIVLALAAVREGTSERLSDAERELEQAFTLLNAAGNKLEAARARVELARVARMKEEPERALQVLNEVIPALADADEPSLLGEAHRERALLSVASDPLLAEKEARRAIELFDLAEVPVYRAVTYRALAQALAAQNRHEEAHAALEQGLLVVEANLL